MARTALKGFSLPKTSNGRSGLLNEPPWHFVGDAIGIFFEVPKEKLLQFLPEYFEYDHSVCAVYFLEWQRVSEQGLEYLDPVRSLYSETIVMIPGKYEGESVSFSPFVWMDLDVSFFSGLLQGWPNRMGVTRMTRAFGIPSKASPVIGVGGQFGTSLMAKDRRLIEGTIKLEKVVKEIPSPNFRKVINHRYLPNVSQGKQDEPLVNDLVQVQSRDSVVSDIWSGSADLKIYESSDSELAELQPTRVLSGCRFSFSTTVDDLKILKDLKK